MARRKITLQTERQTRSNQPIEDLVRNMGQPELGFSPTDQVIYEVDLERIRPDIGQARHILPSDLREQVINDQLTPREAMQVLVQRAEQGNQVARLILGGTLTTLEEDMPADDDKGLVALAASIKSVGLRQPINIYSVANPDLPGEPFYQIGEGERRYWAHQLLVQQGYEPFQRIRCVIEQMPDDLEVVRRRQEAENAARQDLSAMARARAIKRIRDRLNIDLGTRVPDESTIKLPSQRELDEAVGQEVKAFTGRPIGGRMVRNYLRLLNLAPELQDFAEAASLSEKQLRPVMRLPSEEAQFDLMKEIAAEKLSGSAVLERVKPDPGSYSYKKVRKNSVEERMEKRLLQTAATAQEIVSLDRDSYNTILLMLSNRVSSDAEGRAALQNLRKMIDDLLRDLAMQDESQVSQADDGPTAA